MNQALEKVRNSVQGDRQLKFFFENIENELIRAQLAESEWKAAAATEARHVDELAEKISRLENIING
jgi:hypothetical protein